MAIPDFQSLMLPLLKLASNQQPWRLRDAVEALGDEYKLTQDERTELLPSGRAPLFYNRVAWAKTFLDKAGILITPIRGQFQITEQGLALLAKNPAKITTKDLRNYPSFVAFQNNGNSKEEKQASNPTAELDLEQVIPPEELLDKAYRELVETLKGELVKTLKSVPPYRFEQIVLDVLIAMGYGGSRQDAGQTVGKTGDGGIDGIINEDRLGLDTIYVQAKRWANDVGASEIRDFKGALDGHGASKGVFITTAGFTRAALDEVKRSRNYKIVLIDGLRLAGLMIEHNVGVSSIETYAIKKLDTDYFADE